MARSKEELQAEMAKLTEELSGLEETKDAAEGKAADLREKGKTKAAKEQETIAAASEDSIAELTELMREVREQLKGLGMGAKKEEEVTTEGAPQGDKLWQWLNS